MLGVREADIELRHCEDEVLLDPSLALYLPFHRLDGASFMSKDHYGHLCTNYGSKWQLDGRYFDGVDDYVAVPDSPSLELSEWAFEMWIYRKVDSGTFERLLSKCGAGANYGRYFQITPTDALQVGFTDTGGGNRYVGGSTKIALNQWYQAVGTFDGTNLTIYVNGELDKSEIRAYTPQSTAGWNLYIGRLQNYYKFNGLIDEVRIYNRALHPLRIQHNYLATKWRYQ